MKTTYQTNPEEFNSLLEVHEFELKTREIMSEAWELANVQTKSWNEAMVQMSLARAFIAAHSLSNTAASWHKLAEALNQGISWDIELTQKVLSRMVRKGYLRSRVNSGTRLYEVNY